jgi:hypothetical protein
VTGTLAVARRAAFELKTITAKHPWLAIPIARRRHGDPVDASTEIVIEGFPRTGTSFAVAAFKLAQERPVSVACHVHAPAQILAGVRRGLPTVIVGREPKDTVISFILRNPHLSMAQGLRGYLRFYETVLPCLGAAVVAPFGEVTNDLGSAIERVNARFGTSFDTFEHTPANVEAVFAQIDEDYRRRLGEGERFEREVARPSPVREGLKGSVARAYGSPGLAGLRDRAERVWERMEAAVGA